MNASPSSDSSSPDSSLDLLHSLRVLHKACQDGDLALAKQLLEAHPQLANQTSRLHDQTPLMVAAGRGDDRLLRFLLPYSNAKTTTADDLQFAFFTALMHAAQHGRAKCVELLLPHSEASHCDSHGRTALHLAARQGSAECVRLLLPHSNPRSKTIFDETPLMTAALSGHADCVRLLRPVSYETARLRTRSTFENQDVVGTALELLIHWVRNQPQVKPTYWACLDELAWVQPVEQVQSWLPEFPPENLPIQRARCEQELIRQVVHQKKQTPATTEAKGNPKKPFSVCSKRL